MLEELLKAAIADVGVPTLIVVFAALAFERLRKIPDLDTRMDDLTSRVSELEGRQKERDRWD